MMDTATKNLENDHDHILRLIDVMEVIVGRGNPVVDDLETIVSLIKNYADGIHHEKEEQLLFPLMAERGFSQQQGPVAVMLHEHTLGRSYVKGMLEGIRLYREGRANGVGMIFENMQGYIGLLRNHIGKENNILFRMADQAFTASDQQHLLNEFTKVEAGEKTDGNLALYIAAIEELEQKYPAGRKG